MVDEEYYDEEEESEEEISFGDFFSEDESDDDMDSQEPIIHVGGVFGTIGHAVKTVDRSIELLTKAVSAVGKFGIGAGKDLFENWKRRKDNEGENEEEDWMSWNEFAASLATSQIEEHFEETSEFRARLTPSPRKQ